VCVCVCGCGCVCVFVWVGVCVCGVGVYVCVCVCVCEWRHVLSGIGTAAMSDVLHVSVICRTTRVRFEPVILADERSQTDVFNRAASRLQQLMAACNKCVEYLRNILTVVRSAICSGADSWLLGFRGVTGVILPVHYGIGVNLISNVKTAGA
jgi:hypothetical protein